MSDHQIKNPITISIFPAVSQPGQELYELLLKKTENYFIKGYPVKLIKRNYNMESSLEACFHDDVVIFDGSIEAETNAQYLGALELMKSLDYVLIVSRTFLPYNFEGMRDGGAPKAILTGTTAYCDRMSNAQIAKWIMQTLEESNLELPRSLKQNMSWQELKRNHDYFTKIEAQMMSGSRKRMNCHFRRQKVFVSYLSRYSKYYNEPSSSFPNVEDIFELICRESDVAPEDIQYFPPGKISLELMTKQRRFEIVQITEPYVAGCKEFWIYETPDYNSSWWTYGEKLSLVHIYSDSWEKCPDICVVTPIKKTSGQWEYKIRRYLTSQEKKTFLPNPTEDQRRLMETIYVNSSSGTVAYDQAAMMQAISQVPDVLLKVWLKWNKKAFIDYLMKVSDWLSTEEKNKLRSQALDIDDLVKCIRSVAYSKDFWESHVVECPICKAQHGHALDSEKFFSFSAPYFFSIPSAQYLEVKEALKSKKTYCMTLPCGHTVRLNKNDFVYYRWWTVRANRPTHPEGKLVEQIDTISMDSIENK